MSRHHNQVRRQRERYACRYAGRGYYLGPMVQGYAGDGHWHRFDHKVSVEEQVGQRMRARRLLWAIGGRAALNVQSFTDALARLNEQAVMAAEVITGFGDRMSALLPGWMPKEVIDAYMARGPVQVVRVSPSPYRSWIERLVEEHFLPRLVSDLKPPAERHDPFTDVMRYGRYFTEVTEVTEVQRGPNPLHVVLDEVAELPVGSEAISDTTDPEV